MEWNEGINNPFLQDLPFKIELNRFGKNHGAYVYGAEFCTKADKAGVKPLFG